MSADPCSRRQLLEAGALGALWLGAGCSRRPRVDPPRVDSPRVDPPRVDPPKPFVPDVEVSLRATRGQVMIDPERKALTDVWHFEGQRSLGPANTLSDDALAFPGPILRLRPGQRVRVHFENSLDEPSIVHWHGLDVAEENDGHPRFAVGPGGRRQYDFVVENRPGTYWYHPHPDGRTGYQVQAGLAGLLLVTDDDDQARGLPAPEFDLPLMIQDRILGSDAQLVYAPNPMLGFLGDRILVNGRINASFTVKAGSYRLRLLNGSNARIYKLGWSDGRPMTVIGTDGGLIGAPAQKPDVMLAPGERIEVWADFGGTTGGVEVWLESRPFAAAGGGMMGGGMMGGGMMSGGGGAGAGLANGAAFRVCRFRVSGKAPRLPLPARLSPPEWRPADEVANRESPRRFDVSMAMMRWVLNGRPFEMTALAPNERIKLGATEDWEFRNPGGMMAMAHPIHVHGGQFQVVERVVAPSWQAAADTMGEGLVHEGWKDTFLLRPGERLRLRVRFARHAGLFLYHCHNLEHEDMGMMRNFRVEI